MSQMWHSTACARVCVCICVVLCGEERVTHTLPTKQRNTHTLDFRGNSNLYTTKRYTVYSYTHSHTRTSATLTNLVRRVTMPLRW
jgi:hypothetical protein